MNAPENRGFSIRTSPYRTSLCRTSNSILVIPRLQMNEAAADIVSHTAPLSLLLY